MSDNTDPYGIDLAIDPTGDLRVTHSGSLGLAVGGDCVAQAVLLRLKTDRGDLPLHPAYGSLIPSRYVGAKQSLRALISELNSELQSLLTTDHRFVTARITSAAQPAKPGLPASTLIGVTATLIGGEHLTLENVASPQPADVTLPTSADSTIDPTIEPDPLADLEFFADQPEFDTLNDLNALQSLVDDIPPSQGGQ